MYQNATGPKLIKGKTHQKSLSESPLKPKVNNISRFAQARLLMLLVRQIFNSKVSRAFDQLKTTEKPRYRYLNAIQKMASERVRQAFDELLMHGRKAAITEMRTIIDRCNIKLFLFTSLHRIYHRNIERAFAKINTAIRAIDVDKNRILLCFEHIQRILDKQSLVLAWRKIMRTSQKVKSNKFGVIPTFRRNLKLLNKVRRQAFSSIYVVSSQNIYQDLYSVSQSKRKSFYESESNKRQFMANERQKMHDLKQQIDNYAYERNVKIGEMKRQKSIKVNQVQQRIKGLQRQLEESKDQCMAQQRVLIRFKTAVTQKQGLEKFSKGALKKVHNLFNTLKYENEQKDESPSPTLITIVLNKQKFKHYLSQFQQIKSQVDSFQLDLNIKRRNLICQYEAVPLESIKLSEQYLLAYEENTSLKQSVNSLLSYHLLQDQGDSLLRQNNCELEMLFQRFFTYAEQEQSGEKGSQVRDSFISIKSTKSLKKKSSLKTSVFSNRSIK